MLGESFDRIQEIEAGADLVRDGLGEVRWGDALEEDRGHAFGLRLRGDGFEGLRVRLDLGRDPGDRDLPQSVAVGEVAEGAVAGHDHVRAARCQPGPVLGIEPGQALEVARGVRAVLVRVIGIRCGEGVGDGADHGDHARRIEPHVGVDIAGEDLAVHLTSRCLELWVDAQQFDVVEQIDGDDLVGDAGDGRVDLRLESTAEVEDHVGRLDGGHLLGLELQVVRSLAWRGEIGDLHAVAPDAAGRFFEWVERGHHREPVLVTVRCIAAAAARCEHHGEEYDGGEHTVSHRVQRSRTSESVLF